MAKRTQSEEIDLEPGDFDDRDTAPAPEVDDIDNDLDDELDEPAGEDDAG